MRDLAAWFEAHTAVAPPALRERAAEYVARVPAVGTRADRLAAAARLALDGVIALGHERAAALDLLTADGLLTLALLAQAEDAPATLDSFAAGVVSSASA